MIYGSTLQRNSAYDIKLYLYTRICLFVETIDKTLFNNSSHPLHYLHQNPTSSLIHICIVIVLYAPCNNRTRLALKYILYFKDMIYNRAYSLKSDDSPFRTSYTRVVSKPGGDDNSQYLAICILSTSEVYFGEKYRGRCVLFIRHQ